MSTIFMVVDIFFMMSHLIAYKMTLDVVHIAELFSKEILMLYGLPKSMVSFKNDRLIGFLLRILMSNIRTNLMFISNFHPQLMDKKGCK